MNEDTLKKLATPLCYVQYYHTFFTEIYTMIMYPSVKRKFSKQIRPCKVWGSYVQYCDIFFIESMYITTRFQIVLGKSCNWREGGALLEFL